MYLVTIENNGVETVINEVSTNTDNRVSGTIKQGINTINSSTYSVICISRYFIYYSFYSIVYNCYEIH